MPDTRFDGPPTNGTQVTMTNSGSEITPYRVTVTENGQLVWEQEYTLRADARRAFDQQQAAINAKRP